MWDLEPLRCRHVITLHDGSAFVEDMTFSDRDGTKLIVADLGKFHVYDLLSGNCIRSLDSTDSLCCPLVSHQDSLLEVPASAWSLLGVPESVWELEWQDQRPGVAHVTKLRRDSFLGLVYGFHPRHRSGTPYEQYASMQKHWPAAVNSVPDVLTEVTYDLDVVAQWCLQPPGNAYWYGVHHITRHDRSPLHVPVCLVNFCSGEQVAWLCIWEAGKRWSTLQLPLSPGQQLSAYRPWIDKDTGRFGLLVIQKSVQGLHGVQDEFCALSLAKRRLGSLCLLWMSRILRLPARIIGMVHDAIPDNWELREH